MVTITKEDAEFLVGFIDQWLPVCGEKTAERARTVKECLTTEAHNMGAIASSAKISVPDDDEDADDYICPCCVPGSEDDDQWARSL